MRTPKIPKPKTDAFGAKDKFGYMMGDFGCNMSFQLVTSYAMIYFTQGMGLSLASWAIIVVIAKIFDAINDPIIGSLVDKRKPSKNGKFRPWIFWGAFAILITTTLLFIDTSALSYAGKFAYCLIMYCVWSIAYTAANVPYGSLNAVLTDDIGQRASLSSLRNIGAGIAVLPIMIVMPMLIYGEADKTTGIKPIKPEIFVWIALVMGIIGLVGFMLTFFLTKERTAAHDKKEKYQFKRAIISFLKNRPVLGISLASFAQIALFGSLMTTTQYVFQVYFKNTDMIIAATMLLAIPMVLFIPFVSKLTRKYGKKEIATWPLLVSIALFAIMLFVPFPRNDAGGWIYVVLVGIAYAGSGLFMLTIWSFVADAVDYQELRTGRREEGTVYATYSFVRKLAQAACQGMVALLIAMVGFDPDNVVGTTDTTATGVLQISIALPLIGAVLMFIAMLLLYNLNKNKTIEQSNALKAIHNAETAFSESELTPEGIFAYYSEV